jgi:hypothetical protein
MTDDDKEKDKEKDKDQDQKEPEDWESMKSHVPRKPKN